MPVAANGHSATLTSLPEPAEAKVSLDDPRVVAAMEEFLAAMEAGHKPERDAFLARHPEIAKALAECLRGLEFVCQAGPELSCNGAKAGQPLSAESVPAEPLGDFRIIREIGRGGMGVVYEAEQISLRRHVALKVLPFAGALDARQLQRFKNEAQAAAGLHHTNIVPVHFVGCERGVHFYAMQYIEGETLADLIASLRRPAQPDSSPSDKTTAYTPHGEHARETRQPRRDSTVTRSRSQRPKVPSDHYQLVAQLGIQAAEALDYAHQMGIVHRDVKPANLMLSGGVVRGEWFNAPLAPHHSLRLWVTDFGLAQFGNDTKLTMTGDLLGTLRYMSPEQALAQRVVIDHRTDVYSLGATLYELLTLEPVFDGADRQAVLRQIAFDEPRSPRKIDSRIPGELEIIVLKAMEKDPLQRYGTAKDLANDLRRYVMQEPIKARRPTAFDRARKWLRRRPGLVRAAMVILMLSVIGLGLSTWLTWREKRKAYVAEEKALHEAANAKSEAAVSMAVRRFLAYDLLGQAAPHENPRSNNVTVEELLDKASARIGELEAETPLVEAEIRMIIGKTYRALGKFPAAQPHLERSVAIFQRELGDEHAETREAVHELAWLLMDQGKLDEAEALMIKGLEMQRRMLGDDHPDTLSAKNHLATLWFHRRNFAQAAQAFAELLDANRRVHGPDHPSTLHAMLNLSTNYVDLHQLDKAEPLLINALEGLRRIVGEEHPDTLSCLNNLGSLYYQRREYAKAEPIYRELVATSLRVFGPDHPDTARVKFNLAAQYAGLGEHDKAEPLYAEALRIQRQALGDRHRHTLMTIRTLAQLQQRRGKRAEAEPLFRELMEADAWASKEDPNRLQAMGALAQGHWRRGQFAEAKALYEELVELRGHVSGADHPETLTSTFNLAVQYAALGDFARAEKFHSKALEGRRQVLGNDHPDTLSSMDNLARLRSRQQQLDKAEPLLEETLQGRRKVLGEDHPATFGSLNALAGLYSQRGDFTRAEPLYVQALEGFRRELGPDDQDTLTCTRNLAHLYCKHGHPDKAEPLARAALAGGEKKQPDHWTTFQANYLLGAALAAHGEYTEAEPLLLAGYEGMKVRGQSIPVQEHQFHATQALKCLVQLYEALNKPVDVARWRTELNELTQAGKSRRP